MSLNRRQFLVGVSSMAASSSLCCRYLFASESATLPTAKTQYGKIHGRKLGSVDGFLGIPYGGSASGANRFLPPVPPEPWTGIRDCLKAGPRSIQPPGNIFTDLTIGKYFSGGRSDAAELTEQAASEDCLVLNVLTPNTKGSRPVMVYIHGGGFSSGSAALTVLSDRFVAEEDIVLVGVNHRLNVFGYTYLGDVDSRYRVSGNAGQLDLIAALHWVKNNIRNFGGDPANVTIFGESGGGAKVSTLLAMPDAKGLFRRAIIQSGSLLKVRTEDSAKEDTKKWLQKLGVSSIKELQTVSNEQLLKSANGLGPLGAGPVVDGTSLPHQTWESGAPPEAAGVDLLVGNCKDELTLFAGMAGGPKLFQLDWHALKEEVMKRGIPEDVSEKLIALYRNDYPAESASDIYFRLSSDLGARRNAITQAELKLAQRSGRVYMYHFDWNTPINGGNLRAFHTADLPLEMRLVLYPESDKLSRQLAGAWAAFARNGNPNHEGLPTWEPYSIEKRATMTFDIPTTQLIFDPADSELKIMSRYPGGFL